MSRLTLSASCSAKEQRGTLVISVTHDNGEAVLGLSQDEFSARTLVVSTHSYELRALQIDAFSEQPNGFYTMTLLRNGVGLHPGYALAISVQKKQLGAKVGGGATITAEGRLVITVSEVRLPSYS